MSLLPPSFAEPRSMNPPGFPLLEMGRADQNGVSRRDLFLRNSPYGQLHHCQVHHCRVDWSPLPLRGPPVWPSTYALSLIHISEPTRRTPISYAVFCLKKKTNTSTTISNLFYI